MHICICGVLEKLINRILHLEDIADEIERKNDKTKIETLLQTAAQIKATRMAICYLMGWPESEAVKDGKADNLVTDFHQ